MSWKYLDLWTDGETEKNEKHIESTQTDRQKETRMIDTDLSQR
jgi:hypothetical protein